MEMTGLRLLNLQNIQEVAVTEDEHIKRIKV